MTTSLQGVKVTTTPEEVCAVLQYVYEARYILSIRDDTFANIIEESNREELLKILPAIPKYIEPDMEAMIDDWNAVVEDDIPVVERQGTTGAKRPECIPEEIWDRIQEEQLPLVQGS